MSDYTAQLRSLMQPLGLTSFQALGQAAGISGRQITLLRQGKVTQMRLDVLLNLSQTLQKSIDQLIVIFSPQSGELDLDWAATPASFSASGPESELQQVRQEYQRLQTQLEQQRTILQQEFQQASLQVLESWLLQFPTAAYAAQQNPQVPANRLLPLMRPIDQLLKDWGVEILAPIGTELPYDPHCHQLMEGTANPGDPIKVRYAGYRQGDKLLYRAKVSPVM